MSNRQIINTVLAFIFIDQLTKFLVRSFMYLGQIIPFNSFFQLTYSVNTGIAFGFFGGANMFFIITTVLIIAGFCFWYYKNKPTFGMLMNISVILIIAGALGNLTDRIARGHVIDFLEFHLNSHYFPAFNMADSYITIGGTVLFVSVLFSKEIFVENKVFKE